MAPQDKAISEQRIVKFLARLLDERIPVVHCRYSPQSPFAYAYPLAEEFFGVDSTEALELLERLVVEGVLDRRLADKVHTCPECGWHALNFIEVCPRCRSIDVEIETVIHHFACAYVGPWSEFKKGVDLICPKCDERLRHLGMDYEKPTDTYLCHSCGYVFTDSRVEAHCFRCGHQARAEDVRARAVCEYTPNARTSRAVQVGRLHGLDVEAVVFQDTSRTFRPDFLAFEVNRELYRARRYDSPLSLVLLEVHGVARSLPDKDEVEVARIVREVFEEISDALRGLDVVSAVEGELAAVLLPETPLDGALNVARRLREIVVGFQAVSVGSALSVTAAAAELRPEHETGEQFFDYARRLFRWAIKNRPGEVVSADEWQKEASSD